MQMDKDGTVLDESDDSSTDEDTDMDLAANGNQAPSAPVKTQPIIDEDGFQLVQSKKPGRGR